MGTLTNLILRGKDYYNMAVFIYKTAKTSYTIYKQSKVYLDKLDTQKKKSI